jgi:hypothetical protein
MPHQDGFGDNGPEATGLSKPDDGDDRMQKKSENIAHAPDGIKPEEPQEFSALAEFAYHTSKAIGGAVRRSRQNGSGRYCLQAKGFAVQGDGTAVAILDQSQEFGIQPIGRTRATL